METKGGGCNDPIYDLRYLECSKEGCNGIYDLKCSGMEVGDFEKLSADFKSEWICPKCVCNAPKGNNPDTPIKTCILNKTFTPVNYINMERGTRFKPSKSGVNSQELPPPGEYEKILGELRDFRMEMKSLMEVQQQEYKKLEEKYQKTQSEIKGLKETLEVVREKAGKVDVLENMIQSLMRKNDDLNAFLRENNSKKETGLSLTPQEPTRQEPSFANVVSKQNKQLKPAAKERVARKSAEGSNVMNENKSSLPSPTTSIQQEAPVLKIQEEVTSADDKSEWTVVTRKINKYPTSEVKKGGNTSIFEIEGTEKKKFLHVWQLKKGTTQDMIEKHVKNILGQETNIKVELIKTRTEREYASFTIGVPSSLYDKLCEPQCWPVDVEFCEWVWFRKSRNTHTGTTK